MNKLIHKSSSESGNVANIVKNKTSHYDLMNLFFDTIATDEWKVLEAIKRGYTIPKEYVETVRHMYKLGKLGSTNKKYHISSHFKDPDMRPIVGHPQYEHNPNFPREYPRRRLIKQIEKKTSKNTQPVEFRCKHTHNKISATLPKRAYEAPARLCNELEDKKLPFPREDRSSWEFQRGEDIIIDMRNKNEVITVHYEIPKKPEIDYTKNISALHVVGRLYGTAKKIAEEKRKKEIEKFEKEFLYIKNGTTEGTLNLTKPRRTAIDYIREKKAQEEEERKENLRSQIKPIDIAEKYTKYMEARVLSASNQEMQEDADEEDDYSRLRIYSPTEDDSESTERLESPTNFQALEIDDYDRTWDTWLDWSSTDPSFYQIVPSTEPEENASEALYQIENVNESVLLDNVDREEVVECREEAMEDHGSVGNNSTPSDVPPKLNGDTLENVDAERMTSLADIQNEPLVELGESIGSIQNSNIGIDPAVEGNSYDLIDSKSNTPTARETLIAQEFRTDEPVQSTSENLFTGLAIEQILHRSLSELNALTMNQNVVIDQYKNEENATIRNTQKEHVHTEPLFSCNITERLSVDRPDNILGMTSEALTKNILEENQVLPSIDLSQTGSLIQKEDFTKAASAITEIASRTTTTENRIETSNADAMEAAEQTNKAPISESLKEASNDIRRKSLSPSTSVTPAIVEKSRRRSLDDELLQSTQRFVAEALQSLKTANPDSVGDAMSVQIPDTISRSEPVTRVDNPWKVIVNEAEDEFRKRSSAPQSIKSSAASSVVCQNEISDTSQSKKHDHTEVVENIESSFRAPHSEKMKPAPRKRGRKPKKSQKKKTTDLDDEVQTIGETTSHQPYKLLQARKIVPHPHQFPRPDLKPFVAENTPIVVEEPKIFVMPKLSRVDNESDNASISSRPSVIAESAASQSVVETISNCEEEEPAKKRAKKNPTLLAPPSRRPTRARRSYISKNNPKPRNRRINELELDSVSTKTGNPDSDDAASRASSMSWKGVGCHFAVGGMNSRTSSLLGDIEEMIEKDNEFGDPQPPPEVTIDEEEQKPDVNTLPPPIGANTRKSMKAQRLEKEAQAAKEAEVKQEVVEDREVAVTFSSVETKDEPVEEDDEIMIVDATYRVPRSRPKPMEEKDLSPPKPTKITEYTHGAVLCQPIYDNLNAIFSSDLVQLGRLVMCVIDDTMAIGKTFKVSFEVEDRLRPLSDEFIDYLANVDETNLPVLQYQSFIPYSREFSRRCSLADVLRDGLTPKSFYDIVDKLTELSRRLKEISGHDKNDRDIVNTVYQIITATFIDSTFKMASLTTVPWATQAHIKRRFELLINGWREFIRRGGFFVLLLRIVSLGKKKPTDAFKQKCEMIWNDCENSLKIIGPLLELNESEILARIIGDLGITNSELEELERQMSLSQNETNTSLCTKCMANGTNVYFPKDLLETHLKLHGQISCDLCYDDFDSLTFEMHKINQHYSILSLDKMGDI